MGKGKRKTYDWDNFFLSIGKSSANLALIHLGHGELEKGSIKFDAKERKDRSVEAINIVAEKMRIDMINKPYDKGYIGYDLGEKGKLILVKKGYDFTVNKIDPKQHLNPVEYYNYI